MSVGEIDTAVSKAALSAAEPVGWQWRHPRATGGEWMNCPNGPRADKLSDAEYRPVYAAPPAPSVTVKALEWEIPTGCNDYYWNALSIVGQYRIRAKAGNGFELLLLMADTFPFYSSVEEAKAAAQADYEARILSALSAQVQDVAVAEIVSAHGDPEAFGEREIVALVDIQKFPYRTKLYAAAPAKQEGKP